MCTVNHPQTAAWTVFQSQTWSPRRQLPHSLRSARACATWPVGSWTTPTGTEEGEREAKDCCKLVKVFKAAAAIFFYCVAVPHNLLYCRQLENLCIRLSPATKNSPKKTASAATTHQQPSTQPHSPAAPTYTQPRDTGQWQRQWQKGRDVIRMCSNYKYKYT